MEKDAVEEDNDFGQRLRETFHLADVFIDGLSKQEMDEKLNRFVQAFFGRTDIAPLETRIRNVCREVCFSSIL
jgi:hypothetical protein